MNGFDDFDTTITAEEFYEADYLDLIEEAPGDTTDEPPFEDDGEPEGFYDLSDDGDALASAGFGTDEDYGYFGGDEW